jgi:uncharacterized membrane protein YqaE (UPF0057 family)
MKTKILLSLATVFVLASCSSKISLVKRKYNKGFYVSVNKKSPSARSEHSPATHRSAVAETPVVQVVAASRTDASPQTVKADFRKVAPTVSAIKPLKTAVSAHAAVAEVKPVQLVSSHRNSVKPLTLPENRMAADSDVNTVLIAILCIFIPPLAVFLYQNSLTIDFWIDLLLTFLFWLPGIIFAFLVCFAGISLG